MTADFATAIAQVTLEGRNLIESLMTDTCTITRAGTDKGTKNEITGQYDSPPASATVYMGKCRVQIKSVIASSSDQAAGERQVVAQEFELQLPVTGTESVTVHDVVEVLTAANDASLVGRKFTVAARHEKSQATARRLRVMEVTG